MPTNEIFWDRVAKGYAARPVRDGAAYATTLDRTRAHLHPDDRVLELGCGTGSTALKLADAVSTIDATDISAAMIAIANAKLDTATGDKVRFLQTDLSDPALNKSAPYDAVLAFNLLHLMDDPQAAMLRVHGLLKPGGVFISKTVCLKGAGWYFAPLIWVLQKLGRAPQVRFFTIDQLDQMITAAGLDILETGDYPASPPSHFVVARRV